MFYSKKKKSDKSMSVLMNQELRFGDSAGYAPDGGGDDCYLSILWSVLVVCGKQ